MHGHHVQALLALSIFSALFLALDLDTPLRFQAGVDRHDTTFCASAISTSALGRPAHRFADMRSIGRERFMPSARGFSASIRSTSVSATRSRFMIAKTPAI